MTRWRRLCRAKSSVDLTIVALVLCTSVFIFRHLNQRTAAHRQLQTAADDADEASGQLLEISLNERRQQPQPQPQLAQLPTQVELRHSQRARNVDQRIMNIGDFRSDDCRRVRFLWYSLA